MKFVAFVWLIRVVVFVELCRGVKFVAFVWLIRVVVFVELCRGVEIMSTSEVC